jgi:DNA-binding ferritin-like protein
MQKLLDLAIQTRAMQIFYHSCHNLVARSVFFSDHEAFAGFYGAMDSTYDSIIERGIGLYGPEIADITTIMKGVYGKIKGLPCCQAKENKEFFEASLPLENELNQKLNECIKAEGLSEGTKNLLEDIADKCEVRIYKIKQRLK